VFCDRATATNAVGAVSKGKYRSFTEKQQILNTFLVRHQIYKKSSSLSLCTRRGKKYRKKRNSCGHDSLLEYKSKLSFVSPHIGAWCVVCFWLLLKIFVFLFFCCEEKKVLR
jgi:hypothetical protein